MRTRSSIAGLATTLILVATSHAADVRVRCEQRFDPPRSRVSVDVRNIAAGIYATAITSGSNTAASKAAATIGDEVEFDFDSNRRDIARGATAISPTFIEGDVSAEVLDAFGNVVASGSGACRVR